MAPAMAKHERRLADARLAAEQDQRAGDQPAAKDAIDLAQADGQPLGLALPMMC